MILSDATALIALINAESLDLLFRFSSAITVTSAVYEEVARQPLAKTLIDTEIKRARIRRLDANNRHLITELNLLLDLGEASSIALALEHDGVLIIDEKRGRAIAKRLGVRMIGLVGIIRTLYLEGALEQDDVKALILRLQKVGFYIGAELIEWIFQKQEHP